MPVSLTQESGNQVLLCWLHCDSIVGVHGTPVLILSNWGDAMHVFTFDGQNKADTHMGGQ